MSLLSWNCRGLGNPRTVQDLRRLVVAKDPMVVFLCETRCKQRNFNSIKEQLGFDYCFVVDAIGLSGGLCLFWKSELNLAIRSSSTHHIDAEVGGIGDSLHWRLTGFYGYPATEDTHLSWNLLRDLASESRLPWVCMGDFNELLYANEKEGGLIRPVRQMLAFRDAISDCHLDDMGFEGATFTWFSTRNGGIKERLDRVLANCEWRSLFPQATVHHLEPCSSDHLPILLEASPTMKPWRRRSFFRFESMWTQHEDCESIIANAWNTSFTGTLMYQVCEKIKTTRNPTYAMATINVWYNQG